MDWRPLPQMAFQPIKRRGVSAFDQSDLLGLIASSPDLIKLVQKFDDPCWGIFY
jgi:hypothetical protein